MLEVTLRLLTPPTVFSPDLSLKPHVRLQLSPNLRGVAKTGSFSTNKWGFRGGEPPIAWEDSFTIVTIGGSTTQNFYLDDAKTYPARLEAKLRAAGVDAWVGNGGIDGHTTRGHIIFMREVIPNIQPDLVIIKAGVNDLGLSLSDEFRAKGAPADRTTFAQKIFSYSRLVQMLYLWKKILIDKVVVVDETAHETYVPKSLAEPAPPPENLETHLPSLPEYRENIKKIIALGRASGVEMIFAGQSMLYDDTDQWSKVQSQFYWVDESHLYSAATMWRMMEVFNAELERICAEENVPYVDLGSLLPHDEEHFYDPVHYTEAGADAVAEILLPKVMEAAI